MGYPMVRLYDGFVHTSPDLQDEVKELQKLLIKEGYTLTEDGMFGRHTEVCYYLGNRFQRVTLVLKDAKTFLDKKTFLKGEQLMRAAVAAYNSGAGNVLKAVRNGKEKM